MVSYHHKILQIEKKKKRTMITGQTYQIVFQDESKEKHIFK